MSLVHPPRQMLCKAVHDKITSCGPVIRRRPALDLNYVLNGMTAHQGRPPTSYTGASTRMMFNGDGKLVFAPHNLVLWNNDFTNTAWENGTAGDQFTKTADSEGGTHFGSPTNASITYAFKQVVSGIVPAGKTFTFTLEIKGRINTGTNVFLSFSDNGGSWPTNKVFGSNLDGQTWADWTTISVTGTVGTTSPNNDLQVVLGRDSATTWDNDTGSDFSIRNLRIQRGSVDLGNFNTTTAVYYGPRDGAHLFDTATSTWINRGYLPEEALTTVLLWSEKFDDVSWVKTRSSITANAAVAPDGNTTMDKLVEDGTASNSHYTRQTVTKTAASETWTYDVFAAKADYDDVTLWLSDGTTNRVQATFDLVAGTAGTATTGGTGFSAPVGSIEDVGSGVYRLRLTGTTNSDTSISGWVLLNNGAGTTYSGDGSSGTYIWGGNLIKSSIPLSYAPATTAAVVQAADVASMTVMRWFAQWGGTFSTEFSIPVVKDVGGQGHGLLSLGATGDEAKDTYRWRMDGGENVEFRMFDAVSAQTGAFTGPNSVPEATLTGTKSIIAWQKNDMQGASNGSLSASKSSTVDLPANQSIFYIGAGQFSGVPLNGPLARAIYWDYREQNPRLVTVTA